MTALIANPFFLVVDNQYTCDNFAERESSKMRVIEGTRDKGILICAGDRTARVIVENCVTSALNKKDFYYGVSTVINSGGDKPFNNVDGLQACGFLRVYTSDLVYIGDDYTTTKDSFLYRFDMREGTGIIVFERIDDIYCQTNKRKHQFFFEGSATTVLQASLHTFSQVFTEGYFKDLFLPKEITGACDYDLNPVVLPYLMTAASELDVSVGEFTVAFELKKWCEMHHVSYEKVAQKVKVLEVGEGVVMIEGEAFNALKGFITSESVYYNLFIFNFLKHVLRIELEDTNDVDEFLIEKGEQDV